MVAYDIAPPYDENWRFLQELRSKQASRGRPFVLTTSNRRELQKIASEAGDAVEILGKPFDLDEVLSRATANVAGAAASP